MGTNSPPAGSGGAETYLAARREVARVVNSQIRKIAETDALSLGVADERYAFMCECGCMKMRELTLAVYAESGAWIEGHKPE